MPHNTPEELTEYLAQPSTEPDELQIAIRQELKRILTPQEALSNTRFLELLEQDPEENPYLCQEVLRRIQGTGILISANKSKKPAITPTGQSCQIAEALRDVPLEYLNQFKELRTTVFGSDDRAGTEGIIAAHSPHLLNQKALKASAANAPFTKFRQADERTKDRNGISHLKNGLCNPFNLPKKGIHVTHAIDEDEKNLNLTTNAASRRLGIIIPAGTLDKTIRQVYTDPNHNIVTADISKH